MIEHHPLIIAAAKAIVAELARQDGVEGTWEDENGKIAWLDQGEVDMFAVARATLIAIRDLTPDAVEAGDRAAEAASVFTPYPDHARHTAIINHILGE